MVDWGKISDVCRKYMEKRSGKSRTVFPYYALHDVPHLENVRHLGRELYLSLGPASLRKYAFYEAFWACSAYTHDLGMAVGPRELDALGLHTSALENYLKTSAEGALANKLGKFGSFFANYGNGKSFLEWGRVKIPENVKVGDPAFADFLRVIHPWVSYELAKRELAEELRDLFKDRGQATEYVKHVGLVALLHWRYAPLDLQAAVFEGYEIDFRLWGAVIKLADALDATEDRATRTLGYIRDVLKNDISQAAHRAFKILRKVRDVSYAESGVKITYDKLVLDVGPGRENAELLGFLLFEVGGNIYEDYKTAAEVLQAGYGIRLPPLWIRAGDREVELQPYLPQLRNAFKRLEDIKLEDSPYLEELRKSGAPEEYVEMLKPAKDPQTGKTREYNPLDALAVAVLTQTPTHGIIRLILRDLNSTEVEKLLKTLTR